MEQHAYSISGNIVDVVHQQIFVGKVVVENGKITSIR